MTIYEYNIRMTAYQLAYVDRKKEIYMQAWANQQIQATRESGKKVVPVYNTFEKFFDYKKEENEILGTTTERKIDSNLSELMKKANS